MTPREPGAREPTTLVVAGAELGEGGGHMRLWARPLQALWLVVWLCCWHMQQPTHERDQPLWLPARRVPSLHSLPLQGA